MITATVTIRTSSYYRVYDAVGFSTWNMYESACELAGDEPASISVVVTQ